MIKVIAFDVFGTVVDLSHTPREEIKAYADHIRKPEWSPLTLPESWEHLQPHPDSESGIRWLRERFLVVTCSNAPMATMARLSRNAKLNWSAIIPLEYNRVFKPNPKAYLTVCELMRVKPNEVLMVTANKDFGDLEGAKSAGMHSVLIRHPEGQWQTILSMAYDLIFRDKDPLEVTHNG